MGGDPTVTSKATTGGRCSWCGCQAWLWRRRRR